jgi:uncharacterized protein with GYD domain
MRKYLTLGNYTSEGLKGARKDSFATREEAIRDLADKVGGTIHEYGFTFGDYDFVVLGSFPDDQAAAAVALVAGSTGTVEVVTIPLMSAAELDAASELGNSVSFKAAGQAS